MPFSDLEGRFGEKLIWMVMGKLVLYIYLNAANGNGVDF